MSDLEFMEVVQSKLDTGLILKNYRDLCRTLNEEIKEGKRNKDFQLKHWARFFSMEKVEGTNKLAILEVFGEPLPKIDGRVNNGRNTSNSKYLDYIKPILINYIIENDYYIEDSFAKIVEGIGLFNYEEYKLLQDNHERFAKLHNIDEEIAKDYSASIRNTVEGSLKSAFNNLKSHGLATLYEHGFMIMKNNHRQEVATDKEVDKILEAETEVYTEMDINYQRRILGGLNDAFKRKVSNKLSIANYWRVHIVDLDKEVKEETETNIEELIKEYINTTHKSTVNKRKTKGFDSTEYELKTEKMNRLVWNTDYKKFDIDDDILDILVSGGTSAVEEDENTQDKNEH